MKKFILMMLAMSLLLGYTTALAENTDLPDAYTHASALTYKETLTGDALENALQFLADSSHYLYVNRITPYYGNFHDYPETGFDTQWRSPVNGRVYRGPFYDPITRSVNWLTTNPNGSINSSVGSYWACIPPNTEMELKYNELQDYEVSDQWQIVCYMYPGQTVENFIRNGRGSMMIDASLVSHYGITMGWENRNLLNVELKLNHYKRREITPEQYYDGWMTTTSSWSVPGVWSALPGWGMDAGDDQFRTISQFWGCDTGDTASLNLTTDEERAAYLERANSDPAVLEVLNNCTIDLYFDILQIVNVKQELGFDLEQGSGKTNAIDQDHDGLLDRYPEGTAQASEMILQNAYGQLALPEWAYGLNYNLGWWVDLDGINLIDEHGNYIVGADTDGNPILGDRIVPEAENQSIELAENERIGSGNGIGGTLTVKVTLEGDRIAGVEVLSHNETSGTSDPAIEQVPARIVEANSTDVDGVSGATFTSNAIKQAVENALSKDE